MEIPPSVRFATPEVAPAERSPYDRFEAWLRGVMIVGGLGLLVLLGTARLLEPNSRGMGTHQQLGLLPCSAIMFWRQRCPACGMTTSWAHLTRGNVWASLSVNSGGTLLGLLAGVSGPWLLASGLRGRWVVQPPREEVIVGICMVVVLVIATDWILRLWFP
jgi:hypothetical protein